MYSLHARCNCTIYLCTCSDRSHKLITRLSAQESAAQVPVSFVQNKSCDSRTRAGGLTRTRKIKRRPPNLVLGTLEKRLTCIATFRKHGCWIEEKVGPAVGGSFKIISSPQFICRWSFNKAWQKEILFCISGQNPRRLLTRNHDLSIYDNDSYDGSISNTHSKPKAFI